MKPQKTYCLNKSSAATYFLLAGTAPLLASGFDLPDQDAFAVSRGLAVVATADNPSAIFYNAAGLTQLQGNNLQAGFYGIYLDPQFQATGGVKKFHNQDPFSGVPHFYYTHSNVKQNFSYGLGVYAPSGLGVRWNDDTGFRTLGKEGSLMQLAINPVVAFKICDSLSIGGGLSANYAKLDLRQGILWPNQPYDEFRFNGEGWGLAGNVGLLWKPLEQLSLGASFHTGTKINLEGDTSVYNNVPIPLYSYPTFTAGTGARADFQFPMKVSGGVSYRPTPKWNIEFDVDYSDWNSLNTMNIHQNSPLPPGYPQDLPLVLQWESSWYYEFGVTRYLDNGWHVSAGYIFNQNAVPSANYNTVVADEDRHFFSVGIGRKGKQVDLDLAYQFGFGPERIVSGSAPNPATGQSADGKYSFISHAISFSVAFHF